MQLQARAFALWLLRKEVKEKEKTVSSSKKEKNCDFLFIKVIFLLENRSSCFKQEVVTTKAARTYKVKNKILKRYAPYCNILSCIFS